MSDHDEWRNETAADVGAYTDDDTWRQEVSLLTEFERSVNCGHTRNHKRYCPDCGRDIQEEI